MKAAAEANVDTAKDAATLPVHQEMNRNADGMHPTVGLVGDGNCECGSGFCWRENSGMVYTFDCFLLFPSWWMFCQDSVLWRFTEPLQVINQSTFIDVFKAKSEQKNEAPEVV